MKCIVHVIRHDGNPVRRVSYLAKKGALVGPWIGKDIRLNTENLICNHHGRGRKTRHIVISLEKGADLEDSLFEKVAERFVGTFAPGSNWLAAIDRVKNKCSHMHLVLANVDETGTRTLRFGPAQLRLMQEVNLWSGGLIESGKRGAILSRLTAAQKIAELSHTEIINEIKNGRIQIARCSKRSKEITSVFYEGRRIRLSTIQRVVQWRNTANRNDGRAEGDLGNGMAGKRNQRQVNNWARNNRNRIERAVGAATTKTILGKRVAESEKRGKLRKLCDESLEAFPNATRDTGMVGVVGKTQVRGRNI